MKYFAKIKYLGTNFHGFQVQPEKRTVQGELCTALALATGYPCKVTGCSRTDAGVHANEFCITVEAEGATVPPEKLSLAVARFLPNDLSLFYAKECDADFHPRYDVVYKEYLYQIWNGQARNPFLEDRSWHCPKQIDEEALLRMQKAAEAFVGKHDFASFMAADSKIKDSVRTVIDASVVRQGDLIIFKVSADGFLYNMVRIFMGTLVDVAYGRIDPADIVSIIELRDRSKAGVTAPPQGLFLNKVKYKE